MVGGLGSLMQWNGRRWLQVSRPQVRRRLPHRAVARLCGERYRFDPQQVDTSEHSPAICGTEKIAAAHRSTRRCPCVPLPAAGSLPGAAVALLAPGLMSLDAHIVFDRLHAWHVAGNLDCFIDVVLGVDEAAELHHSFEGFDVDLG